MAKWLRALAAQFIRIRVKIPAPMSVDSQTPLTPTSSGFYGHQKLMRYTHIHTQTLIYKVKVSLKKTVIPGIHSYGHVRASQRATVQ